MCIKSWLKHVSESCYVRHFSSEYENVFVYFPNRRADENEDFVPKQGIAIFQDGQLSSDVEISLLDDQIPETEETMFVYIVDVLLLASPQPTPGKV